MLDREVSSSVDGTRTSFPTDFCITSHLSSFHTQQLCIWPRLRDRSFEILLEGFDPRRIVSLRNADIGMTEKDGNGFEWDATFKKAHGKRVPESVRMPLFHPGFFEDRS